MNEARKTILRFVLIKQILCLSAKQISFISTIGLKLNKIIASFPLELHTKIKCKKKGSRKLTIRYLPILFQDLVSVL